jgi:hypothetical protein
VPESLHQTRYRNDIGHDPFTSERSWPAFGSGL